MKLTALAGLIVSNGRHITIGRVGKYCAPSSPRSALNGKRPRPTALFPLRKAQAGQVALAPNPALPKDQPLRGRWCKASVSFTPPPHRLYQPLLCSQRNTYVCFTPPLHRLYQPLRGRWRNASVCFTLPSHLLHQPPRGSWHNTSNMCMGCYELFVIPNLIYNKMCSCLEGNGICWQNIQHPNLQTYAKLG